MKTLFISILAILAITSFLTWMTLSERVSGKPVLEWQTGICPERYAQVDLFHRWLVDNGHTAGDGGPAFEIRLRPSSQQVDIIQAVSGVAGDLLDFVKVKRYAPMGILEDITEFAAQYGLDPEHNYPRLADQLTFDGRQYAYPCNLGLNALWYNREMFERAGMETPPTEWTPEEFERIGVEYTRRANEGKARQEYFFCAYTLFVSIWARSRGVDVFNETLTAVRLNRPEFVEAFHRQRRWIEEIHLMPTAAERAGMTVENDFGGVDINLFMAEKYAMILTGRWVNMNLRPSLKTYSLGNSQPPQYDFKNTVIYGRSTGIYAGSRYKEEARLFLRFLASPEYNQMIIETSDGLPPNPRFPEASREFHAPPGHPNEGSTHTYELHWAKTIGIPVTESAYWPSVADDLLQKPFEEYMNNLATAEQALQAHEERINGDIAHRIASYPTLKATYDVEKALQTKIDDYVASGKYIPSAWVKNPFHRYYFAARGWLTEN